MLRRLIKTSAVVIGVIPVCLVLTGSAPVTMGAAAITGDRRITIAV